MDLHLVYGIIGIVSLCICCWLGMNKKYSPKKNVSVPGLILLIIGAVCLFISVSMTPNQNVNIDELSDQELYEYVMDFARAQCCYNVTLNVWACNESARRFYESCGLVPQKIGMEKILA